MTDRYLRCERSRQGRRCEHPARWITERRDAVVCYQHANRYRDRQLGKAELERLTDERGEVRQRWSVFFDGGWYYTALDGVATGNASSTKEEAEAYGRELAGEAQRLDSPDDDDDEIRTGGLMV